MTTHEKHTFAAPKALGRVCLFNARTAGGQPMPPQIPRRIARGFTLVELMVVVAVIGILSAIAYPNYTRYITRTHRQHAKSALLQASQWMERAATAQGSYPTNLPTSLQSVEGNRYTVSLGNAAGAGFTLTATLKGGFSDAECGNFSITHSGERTVTGTSTADDCWGR